MIAAKRPVIRKIREKEEEGEQKYRSRFYTFNRENCGNLF